MSKRKWSDLKEFVVIVGVLISLMLIVAGFSTGFITKMAYKAAYEKHVIETIENQQRVSKDTIDNLIK